MFIIKIKLKTSQGEKIFYASKDLEHTPSKGGARIFENKSEAEHQASLFQRELVGVGTVTIENI